MGNLGAIEYRSTAEYVHATVTGPRSREFVSRLCHEIPERCAELGRHRVLIETRLEGEPSDVSVILDFLRHLIAEIKGRPEPVSAVAFVGPYSDIPKLAEIASANRTVKIAGFNEIAAAERWLLGLSEGDHRQDNRDT
jgi:hypothetical protein